MESYPQSNLNAAIDRLFRAMQARNSGAKAKPVAPQPATVEPEQPLNDAIDDLFAKLRAMNQESASETQPDPEFIPADFLPKDETRGGDYVQAQPWWSR